VTANPDRIRLLLVDDELDLLDCLKAILRRRGMDVTPCPDGHRALDALESEPFDVVVLDEKMPGIDGLETLRRMRRLHPELPVILLTGHPSDELVAQAIADGAVECVMKPAEIAALVAAIRRAVLRQPDPVSAGGP
jgi:DNA-binding response OmpR family regulator